MIEWKNYTPNLVPLFWRYSDDGVHQVLTAAEDSLEELFLDLKTRYDALSIDTCVDYKPELMRPMYLYMLVDDDGAFPERIWSRFKNYQKEFFKNRYFICPESGVSPDETWWRCRQELTDCKTLYCGFTVPEDSGWFRLDLTQNTPEIIFKSNPFDVFLGQWTTETITSPWRKTYTCRKLILWASSLDMSESVIDTHYTDLVTDKSIASMFRDTGAYSAFVYNFYRALYQGATVPGITAFVNSLAGYEGIRTDCETVGAFGFGQEPGGGDVLKRYIKTDRNTYWLPLDLPVGSWVKLGAKLAKHTPLARLIDVYAYEDDPDWIFDISSAAGGYMYGLVTTRDTGSDIDQPFFMFATDTPGEPRFDICRQVEYREMLYNGVSVPQGRPIRYFQSLEEGLWHNVVGRNLVYVVFRDAKLYDTYHKVLRSLLHEIVPIHVNCVVDYELYGWFFYDPETSDENGVSWFVDEDYNFIEDPEGMDHYPKEINIYHPVAGDRPGGEGDVFYYNTVPDQIYTVVLTGKAKSGDVVKLTLRDSAGHIHELVSSLGEENPIHVSGTGIFTFHFEIREQFAPRTAYVIATIEPQTEGVSPLSAELPIRIVEHTLSFDTPAHRAVEAHPFTVTGQGDAPNGHTVTVTWGSGAGETAEVPMQSNAFTYTIESMPLTTQVIKAEVQNGTRPVGSEGDARFADTPAELPVDPVRTIFDLDTATRYQGAGLRNDVLLGFPLQPVIPDNTVVLRTPHSGDRLYIGTTAVVMGLATFEDGTEVRLYKTVGGTDTLIGTATALNRRFLFDWTVTGDDGAAGIKVVCGESSDTINVTLQSLIQIIRPQAGTEPVAVDELFAVEAVTLLEGVMTVSANGVTLAELTIVDGTAEGSASIPLNAVGTGTTFIVDSGQEIPAGEYSTVALIFASGGYSSQVNITVRGSRGFDFGITSASVGRTPAAEGEFSMGSTEASVVKV